MQKILNLTFNLSLLALLISIAPSTLQAKEISLTFDDCPRKISKLMNGMERAKKLTDELKKANVQQVAFFCNSPTRSEDGNERIHWFANAGHLIANHSADHPDLYKIPVDEFIKGIDQADKELVGFANYRKWFRFPFLHEGKNPADVEAVRAHLNKIGYINGYVTVDTEDWYMNEILVKGIDAGKQFHLKRLCRTYRDMMLDSAKFYDNMSMKALGRSVSHVMLLHETDINALCIGEVIKGLRENGWKIVSPDVSYSDPIAKQEPSSSTELNQGRVYALAKDAGYKGSYSPKWRKTERIDKEFLRRKVWK